MSILKEVKREFTVPVEVLEYANPNRFGTIALVKQVGADVWWFYDSTDAEDGEVWTNDYNSEALARKEYERELQRLQYTPNWEAQAEYDEMHGTINGEDPGIVAMREEF